MSNFLIFKAAFNNSATPEIGTYTAEGGAAQFNRDTSISPDYYLYNTAWYSAVQWFVPTAETTDFEFVADILTRYWDNRVTYFIIADSTGTTRLRMWSSYTNWYFENSDSIESSGSEFIGSINPLTSGGFGVFHQFRVRVRKLTASSSSVEVYVDGTLKLTATAGAALVTCAKIGFVGGAGTFGPGTDAGIKNAYVYDLSGGDVIDRGVLSEGFNRLISWMKSKFALKSDIPTVNDATLTIQQNGTTVDSFSANSSTDKTVNLTVPTKTSDLTNDSGFITSDDTKIPLAGSNQISGSLIPSTDNAIDIGSSTKNIKMLYTKGITINGTQFLPSDYLPKTTTLESLASNSIPFHNVYPRCKYLGTSITDAQNTAIKNRTYDDLFIGDYWTINGVNWRIVAIDYYYNVGDTNFNKGNIIVMPDTVLYSAQMNTENTTAGAYQGSLMRTQNLNDARTIAQNAFGSHLANHRILLANAVDSSGPSRWGWYDSDGVELPNEVQIYGTRVWGSALKGFDVAAQKQQFPLLALAPQFVNTSQSYWLQDVSSRSVSSHFALVNYDGNAYNIYASYSLGVRPSVTLSYI